RDRNVTGVQTCALPIWGRDRPDRHGDHAPAVADRGALTPVPGPETVRAFTLEIGLGALLLLVFVANLGVRGGDRRVIGWIASGEIGRASCRERAWCAGG